MKQKIILQRVKELLKGKLPRRSENEFINQATNIIEEKIGVENEKILYNYIKRQTINSLSVANRIILKSYDETGSFISIEYGLNDCDILDLKNRLPEGEFENNLKGTIFLRDKENLRFDCLSFIPNLYYGDREKNIEDSRKYNSALSFFVDSIKENCKIFMKFVKQTEITIHNIEEYFKRRGEIFTEIGCSHKSKKDGKYKFDKITFIETNKIKYIGRGLEKILFEIVSMGYDVYEKGVAE